MTSNTENAGVVGEEAPRKKSRGDVRANIFARKELRKKKIEFFGEEIELRQPQLGDIISARENDDRQAAVIETLIKYAFVPDTDEKVFEEGDADSFKTMPFGADFLRVNNALEELTDVNFLDKKPT
jgi:hypothetical protein